jgi:hypothetical protein
MQKRITVTTLHEMAASLYEQGWRKGCFRTIAHLSLGYGSDGCKDTEVHYFETIKFLTEAVKEEGSRVLIFGTMPRSATSSWIKAAELVIRNGDVPIVIIPIAVMLQAISADPLIDGSVIFVNDSGITRIEHPGRMPASEFVEYFTREAEQINKDLKTIC